jgi:hypothetical protein
LTPAAQQFWVCISFRVMYAILFLSTLIHLSLSHNTYARTLYEIIKPLGAEKPQAGGAVVLQDLARTYTHTHTQTHAHTLYDIIRS